MQLIILIVFLNKIIKARAATVIKQLKKQDFFQKKQNIKENIANIITILKIINVKI